MYDSMYDRKNLLNKAILMKKELRLLKKNHGYSKRGVRGERCLMANFSKANRIRLLCISSQNK